jgi:1-deoxy-D-xylulose-5-phosphate reductoisomerase
MRTPIAYGLGWPDRLASGVAPLDMVATARLDFEAPDEQRFPCLRLAREAVATGGTAMAICNAANEVAVAAFLDGDIRFTDIPAAIESALERVAAVEPTDLAVVEQADYDARTASRRWVADHGQRATAVNLA